MPETYVRRGLYLPSISIKLSTSSGLNSQKVNINSPSLQYIWKPFNPYHPDKHHQPYSLAKQTTPSPCQCNCDISDLILDLTCVTECSSISPGRHGCGHTMFKDYHHCDESLKRPGQVLCVPLSSKLEDLEPAIHPMNENLDGVSREFRGGTPPGRFDELEF